MAEYIEREAVYSKLSELEELARKRVYDTPTTSPAYMRYLTQSQERANLKDKISKLPAADVEPVVHGRWEWYERRDGTPIDGYDYSSGWRCSHCKTDLPDVYDVPDNEPQLKYCPNCGAKMKEVW